MAVGERHDVALMPESLRHSRQVRPTLTKALWVSTQQVPLGPALALSLDMAQKRSRSASTASVRNGTMTTSLLQLQPAPMQSLFQR